MIRSTAYLKCRLRPQLERLESRCLMATNAAGIDWLSTRVEHGPDHPETLELQSASNPWASIASSDPTDFGPSALHSESGEAREDNIGPDSNEPTDGATTTESSTSSGVDGVASSNSDHPDDSPPTKTVKTKVSTVVDATPAPSLILNETALGSHSHAVAGTNEVLIEASSNSASRNPRHLHGVTAMNYETPENHSFMGELHIAQTGDEDEPRSAYSTQAVMGRDSHGNEATADEDDFASQLELATSTSDEMNMADKAYSLEHDMLLAEYAPDEQVEPELGGAGKVAPRLVAVSIPSTRVAVPLKAMASPTSDEELAVVGQNVDSTITRSVGFAIAACLSGYAAFRLEKKARTTDHREGRRQSFVANWAESLKRLHDKIANSKAKTPAVATFSWCPAFRRKGRGEELGDLEVCVAAIRPKPVHRLNAPAFANTPTI